jgi:hypothetical protein
MRCPIEKTCLGSVLSAERLDRSSQANLLVPHRDITINTIARAKMGARTKPCLQGKSFADHDNLTGQNKNPSRLSL